MLIIVLDVLMDFFVSYDLLADPGGVESTQLSNSEISPIIGVVDVEFTLKAHWIKLHWFLVRL